MSNAENFIKFHNLYKVYMLWLVRYPAVTEPGILTVLIFLLGFQVCYFKVAFTHVEIYSSSLLKTGLPWIYSLWLFSVNVQKVEVI